MENRDKTFIDRLIEKIKLKNNHSVVGIDPRIENIPTFIKEKFYKENGVNSIGAAQAILYFNKKLIDSLCDIIPAVKLQSAYFEMYGIEGIKALKDTIEYARTKGLIIIGDVKRNDIDSTAAAYSTAYLGETFFNEEKSESLYNFDCITVNPYLGNDGIMPFINDCKKYSKGIFIIVKTSNKSSGQLQDLKINEKHIYEIIAEYVDKWGSEIIGTGGYSSVGAVVGATYPEQAGILRKYMPNNYFLVPGYGFQGGNADGIIKCFNNDGLGAIINSSRGIMYAYKSEKWKDKFDEKSFDIAARSEVIRMRDEINNAILKELG